MMLLLSMPLAPPLKWQPYEVPHETDGPGPHPGRKIFEEANFEGLRTHNSFIRESGLDPLSVAMGFAGDAVAPQREFRMVDGNRGMGYPLVDSHFQV